MRYAMIMAGGAGTRLWPMSRKDRPKQLLRFIEQPGGAEPRSLMDLAAQRLDGLIPPAQQYVCTNEAYRPAIRSALPQFDDAHILGEPVGRDTVNAVGFAAAVFQKLDPDALFVVLTADHIIQPREKFQSLIDLGFRLVEQDPMRLVTFSIKPTYPATGFGYVERGSPLTGIDGGEGLAFRVQRFIEKPDLPRAKAYVESGFFGWNSGMFVWKAATFMDALQRFKPESFDGLKKIQDAWGTDRQQQTIAEIYPTLPKTSVDYAVMEPAAKAKNGPGAGAPGANAASSGGVGAGGGGGAGSAFTVCTVLMDLTWLDVGSWPSYGHTLDPDKQGNRTALNQGAGKSVLVSSTGNLVVNPVPGHTVALLGCKDLIVVHTADATLVMPRDQAEQLKELHGRVEEGLR